MAINNAENIVVNNWLSLSTETEIPLIDIFYRVIITATWHAFKL